MLRRSWIVLKYKIWEHQNQIKGEMRNRSKDISPQKRENPKECVQWNLKYLIIPKSRKCKMRHQKKNQQWNQWNNLTATYVTGLKKQQHKNETTQQQMSKSNRIWEIRQGPAQHVHFFYARSYFREPWNGHANSSSYFLLFWKLNGPVHNLRFELCTGLFNFKIYSQLHF